MSIDFVGSDRRAPEIMRLTGRLDASTGNAVLHLLLEVLEPDRVLVVDLSGVDGMDDAGREILAAVRRQAVVLGGDLHLIGTGGHPLVGRGGL
jgi:anti-anti-sigma regulatory factor